jgi:hypothetical protein
MTCTNATKMICVILMCEGLKITLCKWLGLVERARRIHGQTRPNQNKQKIKIRHCNLQMNQLSVPKKCMQI